MDKLLLSILLNCGLLMTIINGIYGQDQDLTSANVNDNNNNKTAPGYDYIIPCYKADPEINKCLLGTFNHIRPYLIEGLTDINFPSIDPLLIDKLIIENGQGALRLKAVFVNITVTGASNYSVDKINADVHNYVIDLGFSLPKVEIKGKYEVVGNVLLFPVRSKGDFWAIFLNVNARAKFWGKEIRNKENVRYMKIDRMVVDFDLNKSRFRVRDIINHGNIIGEAINQFLNTNSDEIISEMKPAALRSITKHFKAYLNEAFLKLPLKVWLPDA